MTLQRRLLVLLLVAVPAIWTIAVTVSVWRTRQEINELFDNEQIRLAQQVMRIVLSFDAATVRALPDADVRTPPAAAPAEGGIGSAELKDLAIAAWSAGGELRMVDGDGALLPFRAGPSGFVPMEIEGAKASRGPSTTSTRRAAPGSSPSGRRRTSATKFSKGCWSGSCCRGC